MSSVIVKPYLCRNKTSVVLFILSLNYHSVVYYNNQYDVFKGFGVILLLIVNIVIVYVMTLPDMCGICVLNGVPSVLNSNISDVDQ